VKQISYLFVTILFIIYIFTTEMVIAANFLIQYLLGAILIRLITRTPNNNVYRMFSMFYAIYGLLTLITQFELIQVVDANHYYIHNDAADAFYPIITEQSIHNNWSDMIRNTLLNPMYSNYPLSSLLFAVIGKLGTIFDVENLRLLLRMHEFLFASLIVALITDIPYKVGTVTTKAYIYILWFSLCSYLYITSAIFTRDTHVCLAYTLLGYVYLLPRCKGRLFWFVLLVAMSAGFRPINGILATSFIFVYYMTKKRMSGMFLFVILMVATVFYTYLNQIFIFGQESLSYYENLTASNTGGLFMMVYSLPFPINQILICIYMLFLPLPITSYVIGPNESLMNLPFCFSPYVMALLFYSTLYLALKGYISKKKHRYFIYLSVFLFVAIVFASPDIRRAFAAIPCLFMVFVCNLSIIPEKVFIFVRRFLWIPTFLITIILTMYVLL